MINDKDINAYMNIKAPAELKGRVMGDLTKKNSHISIKVRTCYALAAALLVIIAVFTFLPNFETTLYYGDTPIDKNKIVIDSNDGIALLSARAIRDITVRIETDEETEISVSRGSLSLPNGESGEILTVSENTVAVWSIDLTPDADGAVMTVGKSSYCISLNDNSEWVISKKK